MRVQIKESELREMVHNIIEEYTISGESKQHLNEMALVGYLGGQLEVFVNTNDGGNIPHFHVWDIATRGDKFHTCVQYERPEYFLHTGKESKFNSKGRKSLKEFLASPSRNKRYATNWEYAVSMWNDNNSNVNLDEELEMPDYTLLK